MNWILSVSWSRHRVIYSQLLYQNQRVLRRSIYIELVLTSREECNVSADLFLEFIHVFREILSTKMFFLLLDLHWDSPNLPWGMQRTCGPCVFQTIIMSFKRLFVLWHSLINRSLYFIQVYIFIPLIHSWTEPWNIKGRFPESWGFRASVSCSSLALPLPPFFLLPL